MTGDKGASGLGFKERFKLELWKGGKVAENIAYGS